MYSELSTTAAGAEALARVGLEAEAIGLLRSSWRWAWRKPGWISVRLRSLTENGDEEP